MKNFIPITYPRNAGEARRIFAILDTRWTELINIPDRRRRAKEWIKLVRDVTQIHKESFEHIELANSEVNKAKETCSFVKIISSTVNLNFHQKNRRVLEKWMRSKKIPF